MRILFAHEYAHFLMSSSRGKVEASARWKWKLMAEGLATMFSSLAFPDRSLADHFLVRRDVLNWYQENKRLLRKIYDPKKLASAELLEIFVRGKPEFNIPPRAGKYLAFLAAKKYLGQEPERIKALLADKNLSLSLRI
jgi:hypothetical protein